MTEIIKYTKLTDYAYSPTRFSILNAGYILYSPYTLTIPKYQSAKIKTDISIELPSGWFGRLAPLAGFTWYNSFDVDLKLIDQDCRGNIEVKLFNRTGKDKTILTGERIATLICERITDVVLVESKMSISNRFNSENISNGY